MALAERVARAAGRLLLERSRGPARGVEAKSSATDPVSDADRDAEALIVGELRAARLEDGLLAEEGAGEPGTSGRRWVIDPLDGTVNFLYGIPLWAVSVAVEDETGTLAGVVHDPSRGEVVAAARGEGCFLDGEPVRVRDPGALAMALVATGFAYDPARRAEQAEVVARLLPRARDIRRGGAAALDLAWVAAGRVDAYYERGLRAWDWAAGRLLVAEAGGEVVELPGEPFGVAAGAPSVVGELAALVSG